MQYYVLYVHQYYMYYTLACRHDSAVRSIAFSVGDIATVISHYNVSGFVRSLRACYIDFITFIAYIRTRQEGSLYVILQQTMSCNLNLGKSQ